MNSDQPIEREPFWTIQDVMKTFQISRRTVYIWIQKGILNPIKIGGVIRFDARDLKVLVEQSRSKTQVSSVEVPKKVLALDDDLSVRKTLEIILKQLGYQARVLKDVQEVIQILSMPDEEIDLLITDVRMPEMNGIDLLKELRKIRHEKHLKPIREMLITGYMDEAVESTARHMGVPQLFKPFELDSFRQKIQKVFSSPCPADIN